ncbi:MAG: acetyl-CoA carboxylase biotin carboxyl carrier protein subunit [Rhizobacter sp.]
MPQIESPLTGRILSVLVTEGDAVTPSMSLMLIESMKMEIPLEAEVSGVVAKVLVAAGDEVSEGQALLTLS